jgi:hypothetical protein
MGHKITNVGLILKIWEIIFCFWANYFMGDFSEISVKMSPKVICPQKKIISRIFKISGRLIVNIQATCDEEGAVGGGGVLS